LIGNAKADGVSRSRWVFSAVLVAVVMAGCSSDSKSDPTTVAAVTTVPAAVTVAPGSTVTEAAPTTAAAVTAAPTSKAPATTEAPTTTPPPTSTSTTTTVAAPTTPPPTTFPLITQGGVVIVANASGIDGAAAALTSTLGGLGFQTVKATNAAGYERSLDATKVYFSGADSYPTAYSLAQMLGGVAVAAMPTPPPILNALEGLRGANVIVMLGHDLAGKEPAGAPEETTTSAPPIT
jgi:outer membrane murein-binding lipoprotein Lpp